MRRVSVVVLILAGLGVAAHALIGFDAASVDKGVKGQSDVEKGRQADSVIHVAQSGPNLPTEPPTPPAPAQWRPVAEEPVVQAPVPPSLARDKNTAQRVVVIKGASRTPVGQPAASSGAPLDRAALTRELQRELHRVGCYAGSISGVWTPLTRRSMKEFTDRVNATLPMDQPDAILLAMLQSHEGKACGAACPAGQSVAESGRCLPGTIVARATKKHAPDGAQSAANAKLVPAGAKANVGHATTETSAVPADPPLPMEGRMALAGPKAEDNSAVAPPADQAKRDVRPRKDAAAPKVRTSGSKYVPNSRRRMGAWVFHDAPVDRLLTR